jgi:hypothetical protein
MRIAVTGTNGIGKSTFVRDFLTEWPDYKTPTTTYRDVVKNRHASKFTEAKQRKILNHMVENMKTYGSDDNVIYDRCPVDNMVYTLLANSQGILSDEFVEESAGKLKDSLRMIDLLMFIPITKSDKINLSASLSARDGIDKTYAESVDNIFKALYTQWDKKQSIFVDIEDKPHVIEVFGTREERLSIARLYVTDDGKSYDQGAIISPEEIDELDKLNSLLTEQQTLVDIKTKNIDFLNNDS